MTSHEALRTRHVDAVMARAGELLTRARWGAARLAAHRTKALRALVRLAQARSPWHRRRLADIDPARLTLDQIERLPVMTKDDLMHNFDQVVIDPRLHLDRVESHLDGLVHDRYLLERYHAVASSGSEGRRAVFVYGWKAWGTCFFGSLRSLALDLARARILMRRPMTFAVVAAGEAGHMSCALFQTFHHDLVRFHLLPAKLSLEHIVEGLNRLAPDQLIGYPSMLHRLADEARGGRLSIAPQNVVATAEPLLPATRAALEAAWAARVWNVWATSEAGPQASSCGRGRGLHVNEDLVIVEPVDATGRRVPPGVTSARVYVTNLYNPALPLIRYELSDQVTPLDEPCACGSEHARIEDVHGRTFDNFTYDGGASVPSFVFEMALERERRVSDFQVRQTERGAAVSVCCTPDVDLAELTRGITRELVRLGLDDPQVGVTAVAQLERGPTGKTWRFLPLPRDRGAGEGRRRP